MNETKAFVDTNILVYAHETGTTEKHKKARQLFQHCYEGKSQLLFSAQNLNEFFVVITQKVKEPLTAPEAFAIVSTILSFHGMKVCGVQPEYTLAAIQNHQTTGVHFWDCLIAETAKANSVFTILTENTKDFQKISGIKAINPFKQHTY